MLKQKLRLIVLHLVVILFIVVFNRCSAGMLRKSYYKTINHHKIKGRKGGLVRSVFRIAVRLRFKLNFDFNLQCPEFCKYVVTKYQYSIIYSFRIMTTG